MSADAPPPPEPKPFLWNGRKLDAARLVAEDALSDERIAAKVGVERRQLARWKAHPDFAAKVQDLLTAMGERSLRFAVARRHRRVQAMNGRWRKIKQVLRERAAAPEMANVPGGKTGLLVRKVKSIGGGDSAREVEEFEVDTGLLKEMRDLEKQVAQEVGQWEAGKGDDRPNVNLNVGGSVHVVAVRQFANLTLDERLRIGLQAEAYQLKIEAAGLQEMGRETLRCLADPVHFINHWCWTYDPREATDRTLPFDLFGKQEELLRWLSDRERQREEGIIEKSREVGVTWICCAYAVHGWLFRSGWSAGFGSLKKEEVDAIGDMDTILEKCRFLLDRLPPWLLPRGYRRDRHALYCRIINPDTGASITGEGGEEIGRGGRKSVFFLDEAARVAHPDRVDMALSYTTRVRIDVSTPAGPGNPFARRRFSGKHPVFTFHWRDDPRKSDEWYQQQKAKKDPVTIAQELDLDYTASVEGICIPAAWVRAAVGLALPAGVPTVAGLDVGGEGAAKSVLIARAGPVVRPPAAWGRCNTTETAWRARDEAARLGAAAVCYDAGGVGAGVKGTWDTAETPLPFEALPVLFGDAPGDDVWPDGQTSRDKFLNLRAEMWWKLRGRFERAYEFREKGIRHPPETLISLPDCPDLIAELSLPLAERTEKGKIKLGSKDHMRARGVKSPDHADALALAFHAQGPQPVIGFEGCFALTDGPGLGGRGGVRPAWMRGL